MTSKGISQTFKDTLVSIPKSKLQKAINIIERSKVTEEELASYKSIVSLYEQRVIKFDSIYKTFRDKEANFNKIFYNQEQRTLNDNIIISNLTTNVSMKDAQLRKQKKSRWVFLPIGAILGFLISK
jgi:mRNA deadenylase 3'-5' endonuclease subunit Ccr4